MLPESTIPLLESFTGPISLMKCIFHGHPIEKAIITINDKDSHAHIAYQLSMVSCGSVPLRTLELRTPRINKDILETIGSVFPSLWMLIVVIMWRTPMGSESWDVYAKVREWDPDVYSDTEDIQASWPYKTALTWPYSKLEYT